MYPVILRKLYSTLEDVELDVAGRFVLSDKFIKAMKLGNQVVLLGLINFFEIWHPDRYRWKQEDWEQEFDGNREFVSGLLEKRELDEEEG
jgi:DNA-binding transcriptional regulator/RsmH inhibitor MraZ